MGIAPRLISIFADGRCGTTSCLIVRVPLSNRNSPFARPSINLMAWSTMTTGYTTCCRRLLASRCITTKSVRTRNVVTDADATHLPMFGGPFWTPDSRYLIFSYADRTRQGELPDQVVSY